MINKVINEMIAMSKKKDKSFVKMVKKANKEQLNKIGAEMAKDYAKVCKK